jgi:hypothetical protein
MRHSSRRNKNGKQAHQSGNKKVSKTRVYDSNGPDVRIRGTAWQVTEKYQALAKDAEASGNWVMAESYYQHAEHYQRIISSFEDQAALHADKSNNKNNEQEKSDTSEENITQEAPVTAQKQENTVAA